MRVPNRSELGQHFFLDACFKPSDIALVLTLTLRGACGFACKVGKFVSTASGFTTDVNWQKNLKFQVFPTSFDNF
jgi:hypothetical protein